MRKIGLLWRTARSTYNPVQYASVRKNKSKPWKLNQEGNVFGERFLEAGYTRRTCHAGRRLTQVHVGRHSREQAFEAETDD